MHFIKIVKKISKIAKKVEIYYRLLIFGLI